MARGDFFQALDELEILGKLGLAKVGAVAAPVVFGQFRGTLAGHSPGQQTGSHGRVDDHSDTAALAIGQDFVFDAAANQRIRRLQRSDGSDFLGALELRDVKIGNADPADFAFFLQCGEGSPGFFEAWAVVFGRPVDLVQIDDIDLQPAKAAFAFLANGVRAVDFADAALVVPAHRAFGEDIGARAAPVL